MDLIEELKLKEKKIVLVGFDWGGSIALRLTANNPSIFSRIISFMPVLHSDYKKELTKIKTPTMIQ